MIKIVRKSKLTIEKLITILNNSNLKKYAFFKNVGFYKEWISSRSCSDYGREFIRLSSNMLVFNANTYNNKDVKFHHPDGLVIQMCREALDYKKESEFLEFLEKLGFEIE